MQEKKKKRLFILPDQTKLLWFLIEAVIEYRGA